MLPKRNVDTSSRLAGLSWLAGWLVGSLRKVGFGNRPDISALYNQRTWYCGHNAYNMFVNHKTLFIRPRNPTARAKLLFAVINPEINLWQQLVTLYQFTHSDDQAPAPFPSLDKHTSKMTASDWQRFVEVLLRENKKLASDDWFLDPDALSTAPTAQVVAPPPLPLHQPAMLKQELVEASPAMRKRRPVDVPVQQPTSKRVNQLLRPRKC